MNEKRLNVLQKAYLKRKERKKEKGNDLVNVLGLILISVVLLALFKFVLQPAFENGMNKAANGVNKLFDSDMNEDGSFKGGGGT